ncbi:hypothetical protein [Desulfosediminicola ganghwensis]|uniref:hypothetical protein n=1 Tax=Desulfosediminicola ganghwensis TaxID=2569540 RepID=UPI0010ADA40E|nr:hypothetical protein [Desulfosediminicola ganghwensis]
MNRQLAIDIIPHTSQLTSMPQTLSEKMEGELIPVLVFEDVTPIEKRHGYRLNNVQKILVDLYTEIKKYSYDVNVNRAAKRLNNAVINLEQNIAYYDLSHYLVILDTLMGEAVNNLEKSETARQETMKVARSGTVS